MSNNIKLYQRHIVSHDRWWAKYLIRGAFGKNDPTYVLYDENRYHIEKLTNEQIHILFNADLLFRVLKLGVFNSIKNRKPQLIYEYSHTIVYNFGAYNYYDPSSTRGNPLNLVNFGPSSTVYKFIDSQPYIIKSLIRTYTNIILSGGMEFGTFMMMINTAMQLTDIYSSLHGKFVEQKGRFQLRMCNFVNQRYFKLKNPSGVRLNFYY